MARIPLSKIRVSGRRVAIGGGVTILLGVAAFNGFSQAPDAREETRATVEKYCVGCHNDRLKTAGLVLNPADVAPKMRALRTVGVPYTDAEIAAAGDELKDKTEMDAVVAYLQVMGTAVK